MPTVLVIDDDPLVAVSVRDAVPDWTVLEAFDGASGVECVRANHRNLDLVLVDMMMPHDGIMTCLQIRMEAPHLSLLPFTGEATYVAAASKLGCAPALLKPASPRVLAAALHEALNLTPPSLPADPFLFYMHQHAAKSEHTVRQQRQAVLRAVVLASSELLRAGLEGSITAAGGSVRFATTSAAIIRNGLPELKVSLLVADSDIQASAIDLAQSFHLPLLIVARSLTAAYHAAEVTQGVVVDPVSPRTMAEAMNVVASGECYHDTLLTTILTQTTLTKTEQTVGRLVLQGLKDEQIAVRLSQAPQTVRTHLMHLYAKLGVHSRDSFLTWVEATRVGRLSR